MASWVYILRCSDGSYYTGVTSNIERRLDQHYQGKIGYIANRKPFEYLWSDEFAHIDDAIAFEKQVKGWSRAKKEVNEGRLAGNSTLGAHKRGGCEASPFDNLG